nr:esterase-like activity of phytase family protein [Streptomyces sp. DSM 41633]
EGERRVEGPGAPILLDPWVRTAGLDGSFIGGFALPDGFRMSAAEHGPRRNSTLEGLTLTPDGRYLWAAMEGPGYDDGPPPDEQHGRAMGVIHPEVTTAQRCDHHPADEGEQQQCGPDRQPLLTLEEPEERPLGIAGHEG